MRHVAEGHQYNLSGSGRLFTLVRQNQNIQRHKLVTRIKAAMSCRAPLALENWFDIPSENCTKSMLKSVCLPKEHLYGYGNA